MKVGDKVTIRDYSYVRSVVNGKLAHKHPNCQEDNRREYTVAEIGCAFPLEQGHYPQCERSRNDTVIQDANGRVVFIHSGFLKLVPPLKPKHVWKHGDVLNVEGKTMIYIKSHQERGGLFELYPLNWDHSSRLNNLLYHAAFLFNIKSKL